MSTTTTTLFNSSTGVLVSAETDGQTFDIKNDGLGNTYHSYSSSGTPPVAVTIDTTAPATAVFTVTPLLQSTEYADSEITLTETGSGIDPATLTVESADGTIANIIVTGSASLTVDYTTPAAATDTVTVAGTDRAGNAFSAEIAVSGLATE